jgi:hypothetical protein
MLHPFDLNLENLKVGDEVVSIMFRKSGSLKYGPVRIVMEKDEKFQRWKYANPLTPTKLIATFPFHGGCKNFMSKNDKPDFYFSANPTHIKRAKSAMKKLVAQSIRDEKLKQTKFDEFQKELKNLLTKYNAEIYPIQTNGDDQGVEIEVFTSIGRINKNIKDL